MNQPNGIKIALHIDDHRENPRLEECNGATIACRDDNRSYDFGDKAAEFNLATIIDEAAERIGNGTLDPWAAVRQHLIDVKGAIPGTMVGLAVTDHSGLHLHVDVADGSNAGDQWDTAFIGWAYVTPAQADEMGHEGVDIESGETSTGFQLREIALAEAKTYGYYLSGEVYGYTVTDTETGEHLDSCWGFYGYDCAKSEAEHAGQAAAEWRDLTVGALEYLAEVDIARAIELAQRDRLIAL